MKSKSKMSGGLINQQSRKGGFPNNSRLGGAVKGGQLKKKQVQQQKNLEEKESNEDSQEDLEEREQFNNKPSEQVKLTAQELNEDMPSKMLCPVNPQAMRNHSIYNYKDRKYYKDEMVDNLVVHFSYDGDLVLKDSNEAKIQETIEEFRKTALDEAIRNKEQETGEKVRVNDPKELKVIKKILRNKFNYNQRQSQTMNAVIRERGVTTEPLPSDSYTGTVTQWEIFDAYLQEYLRDKQAQREKEKKDEKESALGKKKAQEPTENTSSYYTQSFKKALKIMERTIVNNNESVRYNDYKYYFTEHSDYVEVNNEGTIMPLWRFYSEKQRKKHVTSICWNPKYKDLFALGLGSYEFMRQKMGLVCLYSIKNTNHPEYSFNTESGVMSLDFHPSSPALLAVGLYDGTVLVYDIRNKHKRPIYQSTIRTQKHTDPVWQVAWNPDISKKFNFYSISSDGRVMNWVLMKNKIEPEEVIRLKLTGKNNDDETALIGLACGLCFDFSPFYPNIFLVGTEEGKIHKCSRAYSGQYQQTYTGHDLAVYKVRWNKFHERTFISASADWTVKVWDSKITSPILSLDLGMPVVDVSFAPYSSTVLACGILEKCCVYDLHVDKHGKRAEQRPIKQPKLTNLAFNPFEPTIMLGDDLGGSTLIKLSNNLYKTERPKEYEEMSHQDYERMKMEQILNLQGKFQRDDV